MRLEILPLVFGCLVALLGLGFVADAIFGDIEAPSAERRRRVRAERHPKGEALLGIGIICLAAALLGRDTWRYGTVSVIAGTVAIIFGAFLNKVYLRELLFFRGASRRSEAGVTVPPVEKEESPSGRYRIR